MLAEVRGFVAGETFVLDDGGETDLDLGNYERFLDISLGILDGCGWAWAWAWGLGLCLGLGLGLRVGVVLGLWCMALRVRG